MINPSKKTEKRKLDNLNESQMNFKRNNKSQNNQVKGNKEMVTEYLDKNVKTDLRNRQLMNEYFIDEAYQNEVIASEPTNNYLDYFQTEENQCKLKKTLKNNDNISDGELKNLISHWRKRNVREILKSRRNLASHRFHTTTHITQNVYKYSMKSNPRKPLSTRNQDNFSYCDMVKLDIYPLADQDTPKTNQTHNRPPQPNSNRASHGGKEINEQNSELMNEIQDKDELRNLKLQFRHNMNKSTELDNTFRNQLKEFYDSTNSKNYSDLQESQSNYQSQENNFFHSISEYYEIELINNLNQNISLNKFTDMHYGIFQFSNVYSSEGVILNNILRKYAFNILDLLMNDNIRCEFFQISSDIKQNDFLCNLDKMPIYSFDQNKNEHVFKKFYTFFDIKETPSIYLISPQGRRIGQNLKNIFKLQDLNQIVKEIQKQIRNQ